MPTDELKSVIKEARRILSTLRAIEKNWEKLSVVVGWLKLQVADFEIKKKRVTKLENEIDEQSEKIKGRLEKTRSLISDAQSVHTKISGILKNVDSKSEDVDTLSGNIRDAWNVIKKIKSEIEKHSRETQKNSEAILKILELAKVNKVTWTALLKQLEGITSQAGKESKELTEVLINGKRSLAEIKTSKELSEKLHSETKVLHKRVGDYFSELFSDSGTKKRIEEIEDKIKATQSLIDQQLWTSTSWRLCWEIKIHKDELKSVLNNWKLSVFWSAIAVFMINILTLLNPEYFKKWIQIGNGFIGLELSVLFVLIFSTIQYASAKKQYEEYSFKYISAFSLPAYLELISDRNEEKAAEFLEKTVSEIYKKPESTGKESLLDYIFDFFKWSKTDIGELLKTITNEKVDEGAEFIKSLLKK